MERQSYHRNSAGLLKQDVITEPGLVWSACREPQTVVEQFYVCTISLTRGRIRPSQKLSWLYVMRVDERERERDRE